MSASVSAHLRQLEFGETRIPYHYGVGLEGGIPDLLRQGLGDADVLLFLVDGRLADTYQRLARHLRPAFEVSSIEFEPSEYAKNLNAVGDIMEQAVARGVTRKSVIVALGGGTIGNIAGMVAALLFRGIRLVHLPTTPVGAFDSVISLKQAVNLTAGKNLCGTFFAPTLVACDLDWLTTVPARLLRTSLVEMAKNVLTTSPGQERKFLAATELLTADQARALEAFLEIGISAKQPLLRADGKEKREALVFEYGHTVGHAIELASAGTVGHGEAVGWGMLVAAEISRARLDLSAEDLHTHTRLMGALGITRTTRPAVDLAAVGELVAKDNKRGYIACGPDEVAMVLLRSVGEVACSAPGMPLVPVPVEVLDGALRTVLG
ncbi:hypothetical protein [Kitasatospora sp. NPDC089509]|uniref:3-dehydroquinate synthase family protein n=1 Tax=Kitasatospora sp. NPDC089509 TaxID=3364079 RepID=UPI0038282D8F